MLNAMAIIMMLIVGGTLGYWVQDRELPATIVNGHVLTPTVSKGDAVKILYTVNRTRVCRVRVEQSIYDAENVRYSPEDLIYVHDPSGLIKEFGDDRIGMAVVIPKYFLEGKARHRAIRAYYCNPVHWWFDWPIILLGPVLEFEIKHGDQ